MFTFISDAGHGWLEVPIDALYDLDLKPSDFSNYSYVTPTTIYLEEDCDATHFHRRLAGAARRANNPRNVGRRAFPDQRPTAQRLALRRVRHHQLLTQQGKAPLSPPTPKEKP
jgi:hypothetical protein